MKNKLIISLLTGLLSACQPQNNTQSTITVIASPLVASGEVVSLETTSISPPSVRGMWQLKVKYIIPENSNVKKGDLLVRFDDQQLKTKLIEQQSELEAALKSHDQKILSNNAKEQELKLALAEAKMNYEKEKRLSEIADVATKRVEREKQQKEFAIAAKKQQQANQQYAQFQESKALSNELSLSKIKHLESKLQQTQKNITKLSILSPKAGITMYTANDEGEKIAVGDTVWMGRTIMTIPSLDKLAIQAQFDEPDTSRLTMGAPVKVLLDAYPEQPYTGKVVSLGEAYKEKSSTNLSIVFDVEIALDTIDPLIMRPGMKAKIEVIGKSQS